MFTEEDYRKYFREIEKIERSMGLRFRDYAEKVEDPEIKDFFLDMARQEMAHSRVAEALQSILSDKGLRR